MAPVEFRIVPSRPLFVGDVDCASVEPRSGAVGIEAIDPYRHVMTMILFFSEARDENLAPEAAAVACKFEVLAAQVRLRD